MKDVKAIFDIGNHSVKMLVIGSEEDTNSILHKAQEPTTFMRKWKILDPDAFLATINKLTESAIKKLGGDYIDEAIISIAHPDMKVVRYKEQKRIMKDFVTNDDIQHLSNIVHDISQENNHEIVKVVPVHRTIDENKKEKDPVWMQASKLEITADVFLLPRNFYHTILDTFDRIGLHIADIIPTILGASEIALDHDHKDLGCILIDLGRNQTSVAIFEEGFALSYDVLPIGGEECSRDISIGLQVDIREAEDSKIREWEIIIDNNLFATKNVGDEFLQKIITARYEEIFDLIQQKLEKMNRDGRLAGGVFLLGGGSKMKNISELGKKVFKIACFHAQDQVYDFKEFSENLQRIWLLGCYARSTKNSANRGMKFSLNLGWFFPKVQKFFKEIL